MPRKKNDAWSGLSTPICRAISSATSYRVTGPDMFRLRGKVAEQTRSHAPVAIIAAAKHTLQAQGVPRLLRGYSAGGVQTGGHRWQSRHYCTQRLFHAGTDRWRMRGSRHLYACRAAPDRKSQSRALSEGAGRDFEGIAEAPVAGWQGEGTPYKFSGVAPATATVAGI